MSERIYYPIDEKAARLAHDMMSMRDYCEGSKTAAYRNYAHCTYDKDVWHKRIRIYDSTPACGQFRPRTWCRPESCHTCSLCHGRMDDGSFLCSGWPFYKKEGDTPCQNGQAKLGEQLKLF